MLKSGIYAQIRTALPLPPALLRNIPFADSVVDHKPKGLDWEVLQNYSVLCILVTNT